MRASEFVTEACWSDYQQQGMKRKGNRMVPNCVKKESADQTMPALTSDEVRRIQHVLNVKFGANLDVDGKMGPLTRASIQQLLPAIKKTAAPNPNRTTAVQGGYLKQGMLKNELDEDLRKWFREKWVRFGPDGKIRGACARGSSSEGKPKCLPQSKAQALGKKGRASAAARKRRQDPNPERSGSAINVATRKKK